MTPRHRPRTGVRRDDGVRIIRADEVRYPGVEIPGARPSEDDGYEHWKNDGRSLRPARDTGLALDGKRAREQRQQAAQRRRQTLAGIMAVVVTGALLLGWQYSSDREAAREPLNTGLAAIQPPIKRTTGPAEDTPVLRPVNNAKPTPYFASYKSLKLRLPVSVRDLTEVGFHQASYTYAHHLKTRMPNADMTNAKRDQSTHREKDEQATDADAYLVGEVLRMWRDRPGKPDSAVDVGADPGSPVYAPVSGTVVKVKRYKLYGKYDDHEIHIQPDGHQTLDLVMIHVDEVVAKPGNRVIAGLSQLAVVRKLPRSVGPQLRSYTKNHGYHTHIQVNDSADPRYKGLEGAITVDNSAPFTRQPLAR